MWARALGTAGCDLHVVEAVGGGEELGQLRGGCVQGAVSGAIFDHRVGHQTVGEVGQWPITTR